MPFPTVTVTPGSGQTINTLPNAGQAASANSLPVVVASDQSAIPVSGTVTANLGVLNGAATAANQPALNADGGALAHVTNFPATQQVSGTVTANAGSGTFAVSAATLPLPSNAAQETGGNLATLAGAVIAQGSTTSGQPGELAMAAVTAASPSYTTAKSSPLSLNTSGGLRVDGSGVTQPVSGAVTANAGSGTFGTNVAQVGGSPVGLGQTTMSASLPVVIASNQSTVPANIAQLNGSAMATAASGIQKVGITGNTGAAVDAAGQNAAAPANQLIVGGQFNTAPATITSGNVSPLQLDSSGNLLVNVKTAVSLQNLSAGLNTQVQQNPSISTSAYAAGNCVGGLLQFIFFRATTQPSGLLNSVTLLMQGGPAENTQFAVYIFTKQPATTFTDHATPSWNNADFQNLVSAPIVITPAAMSSGVTPYTATAQVNLSCANADATPTQKLYVVVIAGGAFTPAAASDMFLTLRGVQD